MELESAQRKAAMGIHHFAQMNFERKYPTKLIHDIKSTNNQTLKRLKSDSIAYISQIIPLSDLTSSKLLPTRSSVMGTFGRIGRMAPENTKS